MNRPTRALIGLLVIVSFPIWIWGVLLEVLVFHLARAGDSVIATVWGRG